MNEDLCNSEEIARNTITVDKQPALSIQPSKGCPACLQIGRQVPGQTIKAMVAVSLREVAEIKYRFCRTATCPIVYYADDGSITFALGDVRDTVFQKEPGSPDVLVCYCFRHKARDVVSAGAESIMTILHDIKSGIAAGQCACDLRNPQGSCCLGNVLALVKQPKQGTASQVA